jgi:type IV secretion system protein VirB6
MTSPLYSNVILGLTKQIDRLTTNFVHEGYNALVNALTAPLASLSVLFIIITGYGITRGIIKAPMQELVNFAFRLGIIYLFAMNWEFFSSYLVALFVTGSGELGSALMKSTHLLPTSFTGNGVMGGLQSVFNEVIRAGASVAQKATFRHPGPLLSSLLIYLSGLLVVGAALIELVIAKLMLSVCLVTAPLFFILTLFDKTRSFFDRWLGAVVGFSLVFVFVSSLVSLCMSLIHWSVAGYAEHASQEMLSVGWVPILLVAAFCLAALSQAAHIAKSIGGTCHTAGGSAMVGGFMGAAIGSSKTLKNGINKMRGKESGSPSMGGSRNSSPGSAAMMQNIHNTIMQGGS